MTNEADHNLYDRIEAAIQLAADCPEFGDWYNHYQAILDATGIAPTSLTERNRIALSVIARHTEDTVCGLCDLFYAAHQNSYEEALHPGLADALPGEDIEPSG